MTDDDVTFGASLGLWLDEEAAHRVPDHLGEALVLSAATRQRPWWSGPERWLPMDTTTTLGGRSPAVRTLVLIAILATLVVAVLGTAVLTGAIRPPAPTIGTPTNGRIYAVAGKQLVSFAADGTDRRTEFQSDSNISDLSFSHDGRRLAYILSLPAQRIEVRDVESKTTTPIEIDGMTDLAGPLAWSPDDRQILFASTDGSKEFIGTADADGSGTKIIDTSTITPGGRWVAGWSPSGDQIAFVAGDASTDVGTIYVAKPDGSAMRAATQTPVVPGSVSWSPDPSVQRLLYTQDGNTVQFFDLVSGDTTTVTDQFWPTWSPTGDRIATWQADIFRTADVLGNAPRPVAVTDKWSAGYCGDHPEFKDRGFCSAVAWSPDGTRVYAPDITGTSILSVMADGSGKQIVIPFGTSLTDVPQPLAWRPLP